MARRKHSGEVNIGSDSFLDVIANIVGILIILIVIAGVRVGRAPVVRKDATTEVAVTSVPETVEVAAVPRQPEVTEPDEPEYVEQTEPSGDVTQQLTSLQNEIDKLEAAAKANADARQLLEQRQARGELQISAGRNTLLQEKTKHETRARGAAELEALIASQKNSLKLLQSQLAELKARAPATQTIKHRVTPISRVVVSEQLHFRLSANRVSQVPIQDLLQAAMRQAKRHADSLAATRQHIGTVGPNGGYLLQYKLEAMPASAAEIARHGPGMVRIALTSFQLQPDTELREESGDDALTRGSMFDLAMQTAEAGATFTLWVYPDSFPLYRQLQSKLHDAGFTVAGRPLPHGIPIAGSPDGSASAGQ